MKEYTLESFQSTEFILKNNVLLNKSSVSLDWMQSMWSRAEYDPLPSTNPYHVWLQTATKREIRKFDCLHSKEFVDPDPIPELFPNEMMWYVATVFDPDTVPAFQGITDQLDVLYRSKFGPGTPQAFLYEMPIIGWVMYYKLGRTMWIVEVQGNNTLRGGILGVATGRRHFYRHLLSEVVWRETEIDVFIVLTYEEQERIHNTLRPSKPLPPITPYRGEIMRWCGFERGLLGDVDTTYSLYQPIPQISHNTEVWFYKWNAK